MSDNPLKAELETFSQIKESLLGQEGKFALIHGAELEGVWDTYEDALKTGYQKVRTEPIPCEADPGNRNGPILHS